MKTVMISLPILLVAVIACTQVAGDERGKEQRITSLYRNGKTSEHPKLLVTQNAEDGKNLFLAKNETKSKQNAESITTPTKSISKEINSARVTQNSKVDLKQTPKPVTTTVLKNSEKDEEHKKTNFGQELSTAASPDLNKHGGSVTTTTEDDRIGGTVLTSLGGAPGK